MMILSTNKFIYNKETRCFSADISDFRDVNLFDAFSHSPHAVGFILESARTNLCVEYYVFEEVRSDNIDNDILYWRLLPTGQSRQDVPNCSGTCIRIFND